MHTLLNSTHQLYVLPALPAAAPDDQELAAAVTPGGPRLAMHMAAYLRALAGQGVDAADARSCMQCLGRLQHPPAVVGSRPAQAVRTPAELAALARGPTGLPVTHAARLAAAAGHITEHVALLEHIASLARAAGCSGGEVGAADKSSRTHTIVKGDARC